MAESLDRETVEAYRLTVYAEDNGAPPRTVRLSVMCIYTCMYISMCVCMYIHTMCVCCVRVCVRARVCV